MNVLIELHYIPSLEFFCVLFPFEGIVLEKQEHFVKQTYRNRCYVNTAHGVKTLTVPLTNRHGKILMKEVQVEEGTRWRNNHWRTIESAYRKAPYFDYYSDELKNILFRGHQFLFELNHDLLSFCLRNCGFTKNISTSLSYEKLPNDPLIDYRGHIVDKKPFQLRNYYKPEPYYQVFGNEFAPNLSFIDLLFCEGPRSLSILKSSAGW